MTTVIMIASSTHVRRKVVAYTNAKYLEYFGTVPGETTLYIYAEKEGKIVGSAGLDFSNKNGKMPLESLYTINRELVPLPLDSSNGVQICRLIADDPKVSSLPLVYASCMYSMRLGKVYGWLNHVDTVHRMFVQKGLEFISIPDAELIIENIPEGDRPFYIKPPYAKCYIMPLKAASVALLPRMEILLRNKTIAFSSDFS